MGCVLKVEDLCKTYILNKRQNNVLKNVSFSIDEGELVSIMGPSGSGKSTLLYTACGMDSLSAGKVFFQKEDISKLSTKEAADFRLRKMGFVFQQMYMLKNLSIYDNIILPAYHIKDKSGGYNRKQKSEYARELMHRMNIIKVADHDISEVSGGELQRACICRSLINHPQMIFADEPTGSLNKQASEGVMKELLRVNQDGTAILLVTHDARIAARTQRVLYIVDGNIQGEYVLGKYEDESTLRDRERMLGDWLLDMGW